MSLCSDCKHKDHCDERDQLDMTEGCGDYQREPDYKAINADLLAALEGIDVYLSDTLSGRARPDMATYEKWLIEGIVEARDCTRAAIAKAKGGNHEV